MYRSVSLIGWSTIVASAIIILWETAGLFGDSPMDQMNMLFSAVPQARNGIVSLVALFQYSRIWSVYLIVYFCIVLAGAVKFVQFRSSGRIMLEAACWVGLLNACVDSLLSYMIWKSMKSALNAVMGANDMGMGNLYLLGTDAIILGFFIWIIPSIGMIVYLRNPNLKSLMK